MTRPDNERGRPGGAASDISTAIKNAASVRQTDGTGANLDPFTWGVLSDALNIGHRLWWLKRARDFENAKPLPGEFHGRATHEELSARWRWCDQVARACRARAEIAGMDEQLEALLSEAS